MNVNYVILTLSYRLSSSHTQKACTLSSLFIAERGIFTTILKQKSNYSPSVSVFVSVSLASSPASPSVSLSSSLESSTTGFFLMGRRGAAEPPRPPDLSAFTWPARESDCNTPSADVYTDTGQNAV